MGLLENSSVYWKFAGQCTQCGKCSKACESLDGNKMTLGEIANAMLEAERNAEDAGDLMGNILANERLYKTVRNCFFCTQCKNTCFAHNDVCDLIYHARDDFQKLGLIPRETWSSVEVDKEWDIFTVYRAIWGIGMTDLIRHVACGDHEAEKDCEVAFFPGCAMAAYAPALTREVFATIQELGGKTTMIDHCCGSPLKSAGFFDRAEALLDKIADEVAFSGVSQIICVCPGCANAMRKTLERRGMAEAVAVVSLPAFLADHGFTPKRALPEGPLCLSKSCQDRDGSYLAETCRALGISTDTPTIFNGCCGAGGAVSSYDPNRMNQQTDSKLEFAHDGDTVVSMCPTCTYTYAFRLMSTGQAITNKHYAELLFDEQIDWDLVFAQLGSMWSGEYGPWLAQVFA